MTPPVTPMRLLRVLEPFDNPDWMFEPKMDGFRALARVRYRASSSRQRAMLFF